MEQTGNQKCFVVCLVQKESSTLRLWLASCCAERRSAPTFEIEMHPLDLKEKELNDELELREMKEAASVEGAGPEAVSLDGVI